MKLLILALLPLLVYGQLKWRKEVICETETKTLSCQSDEKLSIEKAFYGRLDKHTCPGAAVRTIQCQAMDSMSVIGNKCNGKSSCVIEATNTVFGNPCEGTSKYVEIHYLCEKVSRLPKVVICEGNSASIACTDGKVIKVKSAFYGRHDWTTCPHPSIKDVTCTAKGGKKKVKSICNDKNSCTISSNNGLFGDPCPGTYKYLEITYKCKTPSAPHPCIDEDGNPTSSGPFEKPGDCDHFYQDPNISLAERTTLGIKSIEILEKMQDTGGLCSNGILYTMPCAPGTVFNPDIGVCDWPHNVPGCNNY